MPEITSSDIFVLASDGVYEHTDAKYVTKVIEQHPVDMDKAARLVGENAYSNGSPDNLTIQIVSIDSLSDGYSWNAAIYCS